MVGCSTFGALCLPLQKVFAHGGEVHPATSPALTPFMDALPIPPVLKPVVKGKTDTYTLTMQPGLARCHTELPMTSIVGYNGLYPGPTIRARKGRLVVVTQRNSLPAGHSGHVGSGESLHFPAVHLHGAVVAPESDGHPKDGIPLGGSRVYQYPNQQRACGLWYHDHTHEATGRNVYNGLAGLYFIDDPREKILGLPGGAYEIPLVIQDRVFSGSGQMVYSLDAVALESGMQGDVIVVNGKAQPFLDVGTAKYRFRILNASNSRIYKLALSNLQPLVQIGTDGGLLQRPNQQTSIEIAPSERVDLVVDFSESPIGTQIILQNLNGAGRTASVMRFHVTKKVRDRSRIPEFLAPFEELPQAESVTTREFNLNRLALDGVLTWVINGQAYNAANPPLANPKLNTIEKWRFTNPTTHPHPMHLHLVQFQIIDINGAPQDPAKFGWKDTFVVPPSGEVTIVAKFSDYTGRYVFHCHNLEHEDYAMMGEFEVVP